MKEDRQRAFLLALLFQTGPRSPLSHTAEQRGSPEAALTARSCRARAPGPAGGRAPRSLRRAALRCAARRGPGTCALSADIARRFSSASPGRRRRREGGGRREPRAATCCCSSLAAARPLRAALGGQRSAGGGSRGAPRRGAGACR